VRMYYGDFSDRGVLDLIEGVYDSMRGVEVPRRMRDALVNAYPPLLGRYPTHKAYVEATMEQVLGYSQNQPESGGADAGVNGVFLIAPITLKPWQCRMRRKLRRPLR